MWLVIVLICISSLVKCLFCPGPYLIGLSVLLLLGFKSFFVYLDGSLFIRYVCCKYCLPLFGFFYSFNGIFCRVGFLMLMKSDLPTFLS